MALHCCPEPVKPGTNALAHLLCRESWGMHSVQEHHSSGESFSQEKRPQKMALRQVRGEATFSSPLAFVHGLRNFAKSCGRRLEPLQLDQQHSKQSHCSLLPSHSSPVVSAAYPAVPGPAPSCLPSVIKFTFSEQWEETHAQNVTLAILLAVLV